MGRKGSTFVPFLVNGLEKKKYGRYLTGNVDDVIEIILPRKTKKLCCDSMKILKDWNIIKGRPFKNEDDYTKAKQGMLAALRRSDYLERVENLKPKLCYRILKDHEVKEKKQKLKEKKKCSSLDEIQSPSSVESGFENSVVSPAASEMDYFTDHDLLDYDSGFDSPINLDEVQTCNEMVFSPSQHISAATKSTCANRILNAVRHDHDGYFSNAVQNQDESLHYTDHDSSFPDILADETQLTPLLTDSEYEKLLNEMSFDKSSFSDFFSEFEVAQVYTVNWLKFNSEHSLGETSFIACELVNEETFISKSDYDMIPVNFEISQRLQPYQVTEVKEDKDKILLLFSDLGMIGLGTDISERLKLSEIVEVKKLDKYVLFFLNPQKCIGNR